MSDNYGKEIMRSRKIPSKLKIQNQSDDTILETITHF